MRSFLSASLSLSFVMSKRRIFLWLWFPQESKQIVTHIHTGGKHKMNLLNHVQMHHWLFTYFFFLKRAKNWFLFWYNQYRTQLCVFIYEPIFCAHTYCSTYPDLFAIQMIIYYIFSGIHSPKCGICRCEWAQIYKLHFTFDYSRNDVIGPDVEK